MCLVGDIHADWRAKLARAAQESVLLVAFTSPLLDHEGGDSVGTAVLFRVSLFGWTAKKVAALRVNDLLNYERGSHCRVVRPILRQAGRLPTPVALAARLPAAIYAIWAAAIAVVLSLLFQFGLAYPVASASVGTSRLRRIRAYDSGEPSCHEPNQRSSGRALVP